MLYVLRKLFIGESNPMGEFERIAIGKADGLRTEYSLGNYCGRGLFSLIEKLKLASGNRIHLIRLPFKEVNISGFIGFKNEQFVIFTNTSKNLGCEIFTLAHEIYHLLENEAVIKEAVTLEESEDKRYVSDDIADMFAAELLMPRDTFKEDYLRLMSDSNLTKPDGKLVIELQQEYCVEYRAITKRLKELELIDIEHESLLNEILITDGTIAEITKKLGYTNELNEPSNDIHLPRRFLNMIEENYKNGGITYDDLTVIFSYCYSTPESFGYEEDDELSDKAISFLEKLDEQLGSD